MEKPKIDISQIEQREPVIDKEKQKEFDPDRINEEWSFLTEAAKREILENESVREIAREFVDIPVSEALPGEFISRIREESERVGKLADKFEGNLGKYLDLPTVPDELITPDITGAGKNENPEVIVKRLETAYYDNDDRVQQRIKEYIESGRFLKGITIEERWLIAKRYQFARDVKMLSLVAEISGQEGELQPDENNEVELPSGVKIVLNECSEEEQRDLLKPSKWVKRQQLKDRVYQIQVGENDYILKERKTARHTDTKEHGHIPGLTSREEFEVAQLFQENGVEEKGNVKVSWEKPVGQVDFPDGFQFTVFEYEQGMVEDVGDRLMQEILERREEFKEEFENVMLLADKWKDSPEVMRYQRGSSESVMRRILKKMRIINDRKEEDMERRFHEFARVKALMIRDEAQQLMSDVILDNGYVNSDLDGYSFRINDVEGKLQLEIIGFDFEYFKKESDDYIRGIKERVDEGRSFDEAKHGIDFMYWSDGNRVSNMERAMYFSMLEMKGIVAREIQT